MKRIITSKKDLEFAVNRLNRAAGITDKTEQYFVQYAYGQPRLMKGVKGTSGWQDISPRLSRGKLLQWINSNTVTAALMRKDEEINPLV